MRLMSLPVAGVAAGIVACACLTVTSARAQSPAWQLATSTEAAEGLGSSVTSGVATLVTDADSRLSSLESSSKELSERTGAIEASIPETTAATDRVVVARQLSQERRQAEAELATHSRQAPSPQAPSDATQDASETRETAHETPSETQQAPSATQDDATRQAPAKDANATSDGTPAVTWSSAVGSIETDTSMSQSQLRDYTRRAWNLACPSAALSETSWLVVIDTDSYLTTVFHRTSAGWMPTRCWHSVGGDANRGHTAEGTLWVTGRARNPTQAGDPWFVTFNAWEGSSDTEGQAFHYWKEAGRTMDGTGSDGCDMLGWDQARWVWENIGDGTAVYSIPGRLTSNYGGETQKFGHTYFHVWTEAECTAAGAMR